MTHIPGLPLFQEQATREGQEALRRGGIPGIPDCPYPQAPGFKRPGTSEAAAKHMADKAPGIKERIMAWFKAVPGRTATVDEIQDALQLTQISSRSRVTELGALGYLERTGHTRALKSGLQGDVWRLIPNVKA